MKFVVSSSTMLTRLQAVSKVIGGKSVQPILDNILLEVRDGALYATASDKETTLEAKIELDSVTEEGRITIPAKLLLDILKEFSEQPLTFDINTESNEVRIMTEYGEYSVPGESADDYPMLMTMENVKANIPLTCGQFLDGIDKTLFATANDALRPVMNCILVEMNEEHFTFVASDAHKLVRYKRFDAKCADGQYSLMLPKKPAILLKNILAKDDTELALTFNNKNVSFVFGDYKMFSTLVEGNFPNYNAVIPQNNPNKLIVDKKSLYNALRRVSVVANKASNLVKLDVREGRLEISAQDFDYSMSGHETIMCQYNGTPMAIGFKSPFVQEILSNVESENVVIEIADPTRPGLFLPFENSTENEDLLMLLMPMMV
ncbi:MAG: DNA polymerase III subunit beta [Marinifilaceae bacterium]